MIGPLIGLGVLAALLLLHPWEADVRTHEAATLRERAKELEQSRRELRAALAGLVASWGDWESWSAGAGEGEPFLWRRTFPAGWERAE